MGWNLEKKQNKVQYIHSWEALFLRLIAQLFLQFWAYYDEDAEIMWYLNECRYTNYINNHNVPHSVSWKSKKKCNFVEVVWIASKTKIDLFWIHNLWGDCMIGKYDIALFFSFLKYYCVCPSSYRKIIWSKKN